MHEKGLLLRPLWRNLPNAISAARLVSTPLLFALVCLHRSEPFKWLLLACLLSGILDRFDSFLFAAAVLYSASLC
ncbi:MAG: hypothetical protein P4L03_02600 [Terracidiphilus sp.]|nr:hypothetical protein [Terracidiphilus sp.]